MPRLSSFFKMDRQVHSSAPPPPPPTPCHVRSLPRLTLSSSDLDLSPQFLLLLDPIATSGTRALKRHFFYFLLFPSLVVLDQDFTERSSFQVACQSPPFTAVRVDLRRDRYARVDARKRTAKLMSWILLFSSLVFSRPRGHALLPEMSAHLCVSRSLVPEVYRMTET